MHVTIGYILLHLIINGFAQTTVGSGGPGGSGGPAGQSGSSVSASHGGGPPSSFIYPPPGSRDFCPGEKPGFLDDSCDDDHPCYNDYTIQCKEGKCQCQQSYVRSRDNNGLCEYAPGLNQPCSSQCQVPYVCRSEQPEDGSTTVSAPTAVPAETSEKATNKHKTTEAPTTTEAPSTEPSEAAASASPKVKTSPGPQTVQPPDGGAPGPDEAAFRPPPPHPDPYPPYPTPSPRGKTCHCDPPYILRNGYECYLECPSDQYYDPKDGQCKPRCKVDEVKLENGYCAKVAKIGESCKDSLQCMQEYSVCKNGTCDCEPGFVKKSGVCVATKYSCPWQHPLKDSSGDVLKCNRTAESYPSYQPQDTCPDGSYCLASHEAQSHGQEEPGFCCPKPNISCPVGDPLENAKCGPTFYPAGSSSSAKQCPYQTHYCYRVDVDHGYSVQLCCPQGCGNDFVADQGNCYQMVNYGDACVVDDQCNRHNGICGKNGTCQCPPNAQIYGSGGNYKYCSINCGPDEVLYDGKCYKRKKLNESCSTSPPINLCPPNAGCDENHRCSCFCNYIPIGDSRCEPYPVCRKSYSSYPPYDGPHAAGGGGRSTVEPGGDDDTQQGCTIPPSTSSTNAPDLQKYGNSTFCVTDDYDDPPVPAAENCPKGQFCNQYIYDLGLCCPIPDPVCPDGSKGGKPCKPNRPGSCSPNDYCYTYFRAVGGKPRSGSVCCSNGSPYPPYPGPRPVPLDSHAT